MHSHCSILGRLSGVEVASAFGPNSTFSDDLLPLTFNSGQHPLLYSTRVGPRVHHGIPIRTQRDAWIVLRAEQLGIAVKRVGFSYVRQWKEFNVSWINIAKIV